MTRQNIFKKRLVCMILCFTMIMGISFALPAYASQQSGTTGDVTWSLDADGVFTVTGEGAMEDYASANEVPWKDSVSSIKSVVIGKDVTHVSDYGFYGC